MKANYLFALALLTLAFLPDTLAAKEYSFAVDSKFVNITFESKMDVEDILGTSHSVAGSASFEGGKGSFDLSVPIASLDTGIEMRDEHLRGEMWMDAAKAPNITFKGSKIVAKGGDKYEVVGMLAFRGVEKETTIVVTAKEIPVAAAKKFGLGETGALRVRAEFRVKLSDFGVQIPEMAAAKVSDIWTVNVSIFAVGK